MAQEGSLPPQQVIFLGIFGLGSNDTRSFTLTAQGTVWGNLNDPFSISEGEQNEPPYLTTYQQTGNSDPVWSNWGGWDIVTSQAIPEVIGYGLYKMTTDDNPGVYFYYNTRDCHYAYACGSYPIGYNPDGFFKYHANTNKFEYKVRGEIEYTDIANGKLINAWDMLNYGNLPSTNGFEDFWDNALVMTNNGSDHPRIVWGPYPVDLGISEYRIYRKYGSSPWDTLAEVDDDVYEYIDETVTITPPGGQSGTDVYYYVKGVYFEEEEKETPATNTVEVNVKGKEIEKSGISGIISLSEYKLEQNYPNPFNPTTKIDYSIKNDGNVMIKVYDVLGNEVASLVNERKQPGNYSTTFDAANLPSGIYVYQLRTENFTDTKKMLMLK